MAGTVCLTGLAVPPVLDPRSDPWADVELGSGIGVPAVIGGELTPQALQGAYRRGLFCQPRCAPEQIARNEAMYGPDVRAGHIPVLPGSGSPYATLWWYPSARYVIPADGIRIGRTLRRTIRNSGWTTTLDADFDGVIAGCRGDREPRWITDELVAVQRALRDAGWTRTIEVWDGGQLIGGLYGCIVGRAFILDSAFRLRPDAAKVAIAAAGHRAAAGGFALLDAQVRTEYTVRMGASPMPRADYLAELRRRADPGTLPGGVLPAASLAVPGPALASAGRGTASLEPA